MRGQTLTQLAGDRHSQRLSQASQRQLANQDSRPANAGPAGAGTPAASVPRHEGTVTPMGHNLAVTALVMRASSGDKQAWDTLTERYAPLIWSICRKYRLGRADADDVGQSVWLYLVDHLDQIRDPAALPGWLATTTHRECLRVVTAARKSERLGTGLDDALQFVDHTMIDEEYLMAERNAALRAAFAELPPLCQRLLTMLTSDPPSSYAEISATMQIPVGSIGPRRARCLERLRKSAVLAGLSDADFSQAEGRHHA